MDRSPDPQPGVMSKLRLKIGRARFTVHLGSRVLPKVKHPKLFCILDLAPVS